jgi:hypothetical protein
MIRPPVRAFAALLLCTYPGFGCGGNSNEAEFARTAPPGVMSENPNESVAERRSRTRIVTKSEQKLEARNKAAAEKRAAAEKKADSK